MAEQVNDCPLVDWYKFKGKCPIRTCKNHTERLKTGCLGLEHKFSSGDKVITDSELLIYKFPKQRMTSRSVSSLRKKTLNQVKYSMVLSEFIQYLEDSIPESDRGFVYILGTDRYIDKALMKSPLRFRRLGYKQWMLPYLSHPGYWNAFVTKAGVDEKIKHSDIFLLRPKEHKDFIEAMQSL